MELKLIQFLGCITIIFTANFISNYLYKSGGIAHTEIL